MSSSRASRRMANIATQSVLGGIFLGLWALLAVMVFNDDIGHVVIATSIPYFIFFELGVLSRYVPGIKDYAKRIE